MINGVKEISFIAHGDERGSLVAIQNNSDIDFEIQRIYYIFDTQREAVRGKHAHRDLKQVLICVHGSCEIYLDNGKEQETITLSDPCKGIYINGFVWREMMNFSEGCVLLAIVDHLYDVNDYVFDYLDLKNNTPKEEGDQ